MNVRTFDKNNLKNARKTIPLKLKSASLAPVHDFLLGELQRESPTSPESTGLSASSTMLGVQLPQRIGQTIGKCSCTFDANLIIRPVSPDFITNFINCIAMLIKIYQKSYNIT